MSNPKISIITTSFNSENTIHSTLESVAGQHYRHIEHLIIDGGSIDKTLDIVGAFSHVTRVISEKDNGMYHAMNKGIEIATGEVIAILNSDDIYANANVLSTVIEEFHKTGSDSVYGNLVYVDSNNPDRIIRSWNSGRYERRRFLNGWMPPHPAFFVQSECYAKYGAYDERFKSSADYELMLRFLFKNNLSSSYIPEILVKMRMGGQSNASWRNRLHASYEDRKAWKMNGIRPRPYTLVLKPIRKILQYI